MTEIVAALIGLFKLAQLVLGEIFEAKKRARLNNEQYTLDRQKLLDVTQKCLDKMRADAVEEARQAQDVEDQVDKRWQ